MPIVVTEDQAVIDHWLKRYGPGTVAGPKAYVLDRLHEFEESGVDEIIIDDMATFTALQSQDVPVADVIASCQRMEEEIIAAFDQPSKYYSYLNNKKLEKLENLAGGHPNDPPPDES